MGSMGLFARNASVHCSYAYTLIIVIILNNGKLGLKGPVKPPRFGLCFNDIHRRQVRPVSPKELASSLIEAPQALRFYAASQKQGQLVSIFKAGKGDVTTISYLVLDCSAHTGQFS